MSPGKVPALCRVGTCPRGPARLPRGLSSLFPLTCFSLAAASQPPRLCITYCLCKETFLLSPKAFMTARPYLRRLPAPGTFRWSQSRFRSRPAAPPVVPSASCAGLCHNIDPKSQCDSCSHPPDCDRPGESHAHTATTRHSTCREQAPNARLGCTECSRLGQPRHWKRAIPENSRDPGFWCQH